MAMVLQQTRLRVTEAIFFGRPGGGTPGVISVGGGNGITVTPSPIIAGGNVKLGPLTGNWLAGAAGSVDALIRDHGGQVHNVKAYGAVGNGIANDTVAIQAAITAAISGTGVVYMPPGTFLSGALTVNNAVDFVMYGPGVLNWTGTGTGEPNDYIGIGISGTCSRCIFDGLWLNGDGVDTNNHAGVWLMTAASVDDIVVRNCHITNVVFGISFGNGTASVASGCIADGNYLNSIIGTGSGQGYGIVPGQATNTKVVNNHVELAQRHSIYQSSHPAGVPNGNLISGNTIKDHRKAVATGTVLPAIVIARSSGVVVTNNVIDNPYDWGLSVEADTLAGQECADILIEGNIVIDTHMTGGVGGGMIVGVNSPIGVQEINGISILNNQFFQTLPDSTVLIRSGYGKNIRCSGNRFLVEGNTSTTDCLFFEATAEGAGTATYTQNLDVRDNTVTGTLGGGGQTVLVALTPTFCASAIVATFSGNRNYSDPNFTFNSVAISDPNVTILNQDYLGASFSPGILPLPAFVSGNLGVQTLGATRGIDLNGTQRWRGIAAPAVSEGNSGTIYFDSGLNKFRASLNGSAYVDLVGSAGLTGSGVLNKLAYWTAATNLTDEPNITLGGASKLDVTGNINIGGATPVLKVNTVTAFRSAAASEIIAVGEGINSTLGNDSTVLGYLAAPLSTGVQNTAVGARALEFNVGGQDNTAVGFQSLDATSTGSDNTAVGWHAGDFNTIGSNNVYLGSQANASAANLSNAVAIGYQASVAASDSMVLGNGSMNVGIRTSTPKLCLDVNGAIGTRHHDETFVNGANQDFALTLTSFVRVIGPTAPFSIGGLANGVDGRILFIRNTTAFQMTINHLDAGSIAVNQIVTPTAAPINCSVATLHYDDTDDLWIVFSYA